MSLQEVDVAIIGSGPAGMSAAMAAREHGLKVTVLDEQPSAGGQIYRGVLSVPKERSKIIGSDYEVGRSLAKEFSKCGAQRLLGASVWQVTKDRRIDYLQDGQHHELQANAIILCTGAMERPFPVPGWTLPGVMTVGGAQILLKTADAVPAGSVVLAGCGPLLLLLAVQYIRAGLRVTAIVDTTDTSNWWHAIPYLPSALRDWRLLTKGIGLIRELHRSGTTLFKGVSDITIEGETQVRAIHFRVGKIEHRVQTQLVLLHQGVIPNTQITRSLRAEHNWDQAQLCFTPILSEYGELEGRPGFYVAGDGARIMGAMASVSSGRIAGLSAAHAVIGENFTQEISASINLEVCKLKVLTAARPMLDRLYMPKIQSRIPQDSVVVCRCEEVTAGEIRQHVRAGCIGPNQLKAYSRCGMGPCQGRQCGITVCEIIAAERGVTPTEIGYQRVRNPIKPITVGELAGF